MEEEITQEGTSEMEETPYTQSTACVHDMVLESADIAVCSKGCGHGCMFNAKTQEIIAGVIVNKA